MSESSANPGVLAALDKLRQHALEQADLYQPAQPKHLEWSGYAAGVQAARHEVKQWLDAGRLAEPGSESPD